MSNGRLAIPNQIDIGVHCHDGPHAQPISVVIPKPGLIEVHAWGGFSKLEAAAVQIAAGMVGRIDDLEYIRTRSVRLATNILDACREASQPKSEGQE